MRHTEESKNVPMYITNRPCESAGPFRGNLVVSMRPLLPGDVPRATAITRRFPRVHGAPVHVGAPAALGIAALDRPDFGDAVCRACGSGLGRTSQPFSPYPNPNPNP
jgi:uncharacterized protein YcsI (UPF0317 family)